MKINRFSFNSLQSTVEMAEKKETQQFTEMRVNEMEVLRNTQSEDTWSGE